MFVAQRGDKHMVGGADTLSRWATAFRRLIHSPEIIHLSVAMHFRYPLAPRDVEAQLPERGIDIDHATRVCQALTEAPDRLSLFALARDSRLRLLPPAPIALERVL
ncbi:MAG: hypothetical protein BGP12_15170 [Rhodospirillales bacterium 70-18]|nr:MAG: hypothetical protein BGP12_15170 [Rhodospirillales bacterium 70-18]